MNPIDRVLQDLDQIIRESVAENSALLLFAFVYKKTTERIQREIAAGAFEDNERMVHFDVYFANLYIQAYQNYKTGQPVSAVWQLAFEQRYASLSTLQHILLGMSAHINYDLALTTQYFAQTYPLEALRPDFDKVNDILADLTRSMLNSLDAVSPLLFLLDWLGQKSDEKLINFSIREARTQSFRLATLLHEAPDPAPVLETASEILVALSQRIIRPKSWALARALGLIQRFEPKDMRQVLPLLEQHFKESTSGTTRAHL